MAGAGFERRSPSWWAVFFCLFPAVSGCLPVPVSTVPLHSREKRPVAAETAASERSGTFSSPAFDPAGALLAVYDSGSDRIRIFRSANLVQVDSLKPARRPRRLGFSPSGRFLVIEAYQGWIDDSMKNGSDAFRDSSSHVDISSPAAVRDDIQRVEVRDLRSGRSITDLSCDAVVTTGSEGGWLWARNWAITPGYRSSALLEAHFSADEEEFSALCWNGVSQRWSSRTWDRLEDVPSPPFWDALMGSSTASWLAQNDPAGKSSDGRTVILAVRRKRFGFAAIHLWDRDAVEVRSLPGECGNRLLPAYALSRDGKKLAIACNLAMGYSIRAWDLGTGKEIPLKNAEFGLGGGLPSLTRGGVALSNGGRYLAAALLEQMEALVPNVFLIPAGIQRSDLRIWSVDEGRELVSVEIDDLVGSTYFFGGVDLAFSPDDSMLAVAGRRLRMYRMSDLSFR